MRSACVYRQDLDHVSPLFCTLRIGPCIHEHITDTGRAQTPCYPLRGSPCVPLTELQMQEMLSACVHNAMQERGAFELATKIEGPLQLS